MRGRNEAERLFDIGQSPFRERLSEGNKAYRRFGVRRQLLSELIVWFRPKVDRRFLKDSSFLRIFCSVETKGNDYKRLVQPFPCILEFERLKGSENRVTKV